METALDRASGGFPVQGPAHRLHAGLEAQETVPTKAIHKHGNHQPGQSQERYGYLLDGQQRLTALLHLRERDEDYPLCFWAWPGSEADGCMQFYWRGKS